ncbi:hypothetical protein DL766_004948 [Monosporascus sp. MC13-8B]|uniref:AAA+ ATPase domain-containing protein n=1 Tax=Monosporascus cannonballus TaxID=155416 RepID=A0ABY0H6I3_9PEZI|nr:hypothetical protein DL762_006371 [Monosporascus cannonballus]RYO97020.1 hypothetical protein DL763_002957 [Monosporascus cannonballus]RYP30276.1 hypothetical protein DL766_004948 [Monosporascus sp. MC13-8B]
MSNPEATYVRPPVVDDEISTPEACVDMAGFLNQATDAPKGATASAEDVGKGTDPKVEREEAKEKCWENKRRKLPLVVDARWLNFEQFKNRYSLSEGMEIIEFLRGHPHIAQEVAREKSRRTSKKGDTRPARPIADADTNWIQRIRIQSPQLLLLLSRLTGHGDQWTITRPRVFFQPFRIFYYYLKPVKKCLKILEDRWSNSSTGHNHETFSLADAEALLETGPSKGEGPESDSFGDDGFPEDAAVAGEKDPEVVVSGPLLDSPVTLSHVRKYVELVENYIKPLWEKAKGTSKRKIRFQDLSMSFQSGELLYVPPVSDYARNTETAKASTVKMYQSAWRLYSMVLSPVKDVDPDDTHKLTKREIFIYAYYYDYDGTSYIPVSHRFAITDYEGEKDITTLQIYPMRFHKDAEKIKAGLHKQGQWFQQAVRQRHLCYDGWTLTHGPTGGTIESTKMSNLPTREHIDGDVIIDFVEGYKSDAAVGPGPSSWDELADFDDSGWPVGDDELSIRYLDMTANRQLRVIGELKDMTQRGEWYGGKMQNEHIKSRSRLKAFNEGKHVTVLEDDDLILLPRRVVGYAFRERKFYMLDIQALMEIPASQDVFKDLKIDPTHRTMVLSLVKSHLEKQATQKQRPSVNLNQDLIRGKGSGLVILLHGVPGVGKTATAEAVAQVFKKPLFVITCGDLGFLPGDVEDALRGIFRLAHHWDCVLLLDEADIFLSRRELGDLKRNALVSGNQTVDIFKVNIRKLEEIEKKKQDLLAETNPDAPKPPAMAIDKLNILRWAASHFDRHKKSPEQRWNGRQIRNAFQIAYSLAHFDIDTPGDPQIENESSQHPSEGGGVDVPVRVPHLDWVHFDKVAQAIEKFEDYLYHAAAETPMDQAKRTHIRYDYYPTQETQHPTGYLPPPSYRNQSQIPTNTRPAPLQGQRPRQQQELAREEQRTPTRMQNSGQPQQRRLNVPGKAQQRSNMNAPAQQRTPSPVASRQYTHMNPSPGRARKTPLSKRNDSGYSSWGTDPRMPDPLSAQDTHGQDDEVDAEFYDFEGEQGPQGNHGDNDSYFDQPDMSYENEAVAEEFDDF